MICCIALCLIAVPLGSINNGSELLRGLEMPCSDIKEGLGVKGLVIIRLNIAFKKDSARVETSCH